MKNYYSLALFALFIVGCSNSGPSSEIAEKTNQSRAQLLKHFESIKTDKALSLYVERSLQKSGLAVPAQILEKIPVAINELMHESNFDHQEGDWSIYNVTCESMAKIMPESHIECNQNQSKDFKLQIGLLFGEENTKINLIVQGKKLALFEIGSEHTSVSIEDLTFLGKNNTGSLKLTYEKGANIIFELKKGFEMQSSYGDVLIKIGPATGKVNLQTGEYVADLNEIRFGKKIFPAMRIQEMAFEDGSMKCYEQVTGEEIIGCEEELKAIQNSFQSIQ
ncbi:MAG: hypothetical protein WCK49_00145 [Myxococcaceae bacterium]